MLTIYSIIFYLNGTKCCRKEGGCKECQYRAGLFPQNSGSSVTGKQTSLFNFLDYSSQQH